MIGICKYCGNEKKLCKAHIIPKEFYKNYRTEKYRAVKSIDLTWTQCQNGVWDDSILCAECDSLIGKYDNEAYRVLKNNLIKHKSGDGKSVYIYKKDEFNYEYLRKFFISLIWRASISSKDICKCVKLNKYKNIALKLLKNKISDDNLYFKTVVVREVDNIKYDSTVIVLKQKMGNKICYKFFFYQFIVIIVPSLDNVVWKQDKPIPEKLFLSQEEFAIIEDESFLTEKLDVLNHVRKNILKK